MARFGSNCIEFCGVWYTVLRLSDSHEGTIQFDGRGEVDAYKENIKYSAKSKALCATR